MGQGQEIHARNMIADCMANGGWVLLQNMHLSLPFCTEAMDALSDSEDIHNTFRMWITTEVHPQFPIALLQVNGIFLFFWPSRNMRSTTKILSQRFETRDEYTNDLVVIHYGRTRFRHRFRFDESHVLSVESLLSVGKPVFAGLNTVSADRI